MKKTEKTKTNIKSEPYVLKATEVEWVAKALSTDERQRTILTVGAIAYYDGSAVLVATDAHRMHIVRLGPVVAEFPVKLIDLRRVLLEANFAKATHVQISEDFSEVVVGKYVRGAKSDVIGVRIAAPVFDTVIGTYPHFSQVIPDTKRPVAELFAINSEYLADATWLAWKNKFKTIMYSEDAENRPIAFRSIEEHWFAVIMPMPLEVWAKDANKENAKVVAGL
jgi:hypothetical protein